MTTPTVSLRQRVLVLEDRCSALEVLHAYGLAIDAHDATRWLDCFKAFHKHLLVWPVAAISGSTGACEAQFVHLIDLHRRPRLRSYGRYVDRLTKGPDGCWRIAERVAHVEARDER